MPRLGGYEVLDFLRADPATASVPFLMLTASAEQEEADRCMARGASAYLTKPFSVSGLLEVVRGLLAAGA
jgi:CheY-like chemotaxis protein